MSPSSLYLVTSDLRRKKKIMHTTFCKTHLKILCYLSKGDLHSWSSWNNVITVASVVWWMRNYFEVIMAFWVRKPHLRNSTMSRFNVYSWGEYYLLYTNCCTGDDKWEGKEKVKVQSNYSRSTHIKRVATQWEIWVLFSLEMFYSHINTDNTIYCVKKENLHYNFLFRNHLSLSYNLSLIKE